MCGIDHRKPLSVVKKIICSLLSLSFLSSMILPPSYAQQITSLPAAGQMVWLSPGYQPIVLKGVTTHMENPFLLDFIVDRGQTKAGNQDLKAEGEKLVKYFLASLTIPDQDAWVNLSPYEKDRIIPQDLSSTEMGQKMLEQDYLLKQLSASLTNPDKDLGQQFWNEVAKRSAQDVPRSTFNKVWITSGGATVVEKDGFAYITQSHLKVMLEEDFIAMQGGNTDKAKADPKTTENNKVSSQAFRQVILPQLEKEVNEGKNFAPIRQVYQSVILATWYKKALKESLLGKVYADQAKVEGVNTADKDFKNKVYEQYLQAFRKGAYNLIKEETDANTDEIIPRKYFSGGVTALGNTADLQIERGSAAVLTVGQALLTQTRAGTATVLTAQLAETNDETKTASSVLENARMQAHREAIIKELAGFLGGQSPTQVRSRLTEKGVSDQEIDRIFFSKIRTPDTSFGRSAEEGVILAVAVELFRTYYGGEPWARSSSGVVDPKWYGYIGLDNIRNISKAVVADLQEKQPAMKRVFSDPVQIAIQRNLSLTVISFVRAIIMDLSKAQGVNINANQLVADIKNEMTNQVGVAVDDWNNIQAMLGLDVEGQRQIFIDQVIAEIDAMAYSYSVIASKMNYLLLWDSDQGGNVPVEDLMDFVVGKTEVIPESSQKVLKQIALLDVKGQVPDQVRSYLNSKLRSSSGITERAVFNLFLNIQKVVNRVNETRQARGKISDLQAQTQIPTPELKIILNYLRLSHNGDEYFPGPSSYDGTPIFGKEQWLLELSRVNPPILTSDGQVMSIPYEVFDAILSMIRELSGPSNTKVMNRSLAFTVSELQSLIGQGFFSGLNAQNALYTGSVLTLFGFNVYNARTFKDDAILDMGNAGRSTDLILQYAGSRTNFEQSLQSRGLVSSSAIDEKVIRAKAAEVLSQLPDIAAELSKEQADHARSVINVLLRRAVARIENGEPAIQNYEQAGQEVQFVYDVFSTMVPEVEWLTKAQLKQTIYKDLRLEDETEPDHLTDARLLAFMQRINQAAYELTFEFTRKMNEAAIQAALQQQGSKLNPDMAVAVLRYVTNPEHAIYDASAQTLKLSIDAKALEEAFQSRRGEFANFAQGRQFSEVEGALQFLNLEIGSFAVVYGAVQTSMKAQENPSEPSQVLYQFEGTRAQFLTAMQGKGFYGQSDSTPKASSGAFASKDTYGGQASPVSGQASTPVGGIDFDPSKLDLQIKRDGRGVPLPLLEQDLEHINIKGLFPIIINIQPMTTVPAVLGLKDDELQKAEQVARRS